MICMITIFINVGKMTTMKSYKLPALRREKTVTFPGVPDGSYDSTMAEIEKELRLKMRENEIREAQSIRFASNFVTTPPLDDD